MRNGCGCQWGIPRIPPKTSILRGKIDPIFRETNDKLRMEHLWLSLYAIILWEASLSFDVLGNHFWNLNNDDLFKTHYPPEKKRQWSCIRKDTMHVDHVPTEKHNMDFTYRYRCVSLRQGKAYTFLLFMFPLTLYVAVWGLAGVKKMKSEL